MNEEKGCYLVFLKKMMAVGQSPVSLKNEVKNEVFRSLARI